MKKRIIIIFIIILMLIPLFLFNEGEASNKKVNKKSNNNKKQYKVESDNISEIIKENVTEKVKENIIIEERKVEEYSKENKFKYITVKYDNINEYIKEEEKEIEEIKYICIKEENKNLKNEDGKTYYYEGNNKVKGLKLIDNKRYYFDFETGELINDNVKSVIDISSWQGEINFDKVKETNLVDSVIVRVGYGTTDDNEPVLDSRFEGNINELKRVNIPYDIYLYGYAQDINSSNKEVDFIEKIFKKYKIPKETFIWYDAELTTFNSFYYSRPIYNMIVDNFVYKLNNLGYKNVGLYSNLYMLTKGNLSFEKKYPVWVAQYYKKCDYIGEHKGWQYTSDGKIDGIEGKVDMNIFY